MQTHHVIQINEGVIDCHNLDLLGMEGSTGHQTTNTAKSKAKSQVYFVIMQLTQCTITWLY